MHARLVLLFHTGANHKLRLGKWESNLLETIKLRGGELFILEGNEVLKKMVAYVYRLYATQNEDLFVTISFHIFQRHTQALHSIFPSVSFSSFLGIGFPYM